MTARIAFDTTVQQLSVALEQRKDVVALALTGSGVSGEPDEWKGSTPMSSRSRVTLSSR
jgi:hypothetical protein